jgi:hypothetical protein
MEYPHDIEQLCQFFMNQSANIETERLHLTRYPCPPERSTAINLRCNIQLSQMMDRMEQSLRLLEDARGSRKSKSSKPSKKQRANFPKKSIQIMENWYQQHMDYPYPDQITAELLALQGGITVEQVKKWFGNKRNRCHNTRNLTEIAKVKREKSFGSFL